MSDPRKAALIRFTWDDGPLNFDLFEGSDCVNRAHDFKRVIQGDFPGSEFVVVGNEAACEDRAGIFVGTNQPDPTR